MLALVLIASYTDLDHDLDMEGMLLVVPLPLLQSEAAGGSTLRDAGRGKDAGTSLAAGDGGCYYLWLFRLNRIKKVLTIVIDKIIVYE